MRLPGGAAEPDRKLAEKLKLTFSESMSILA
jgi:hypothetical protein